MAKEPFQFHLWYFVVAFLIILLFLLFKNPAENVNYSDFQALLKANLVNGVILDENYITATLKPGGLENVLSKEKIQKIKQVGKGTYSINTVRINDPALIQELDAAKVPFTGQIESKWVSALSWIIPIFIFIGLWSFLTKRSGGVGSGAMAFGKNKAKIYMGVGTYFP